MQDSADINTCPMGTLAQYMEAREAQGAGAVIPCAGEPVSIRRGEKMVWASDGTMRGWYSYTTDVFTPESI